MDANDEKIITEQLHLLGNNQDILKHAVANQVGIINKTIGQLETLEQTIDYNTKLLKNSLQQIQEARWETVKREEIDEHFTILNAVIADISRDQNDILMYLTSATNGFLPPQLTPIKDILDQLEGAAAHLPENTYFPFLPAADNWLQIERFLTINVYYKDNNIFTILKIPLITYPTYEIINVIPLPIHAYNDTFIIAGITHTKVAVSIESHTYLNLDEKDLDECISVNHRYICAQNKPVYRIDTDSPCEIQMYTNPSTIQACPAKFINSGNTIIISLETPNAWLFSAFYEQIIRIKCSNGKEYVDKITETGIIKAQIECKFSVDGVVLQSQGIIENQELVAYMPKYNLTLSQSNMAGKGNVSKITYLKPKTVIKNLNELTDLQKELGSVTTELDSLKNPLGKYEHLIYSTAPSGAAIIIIIALIVYILFKIKKRKTRSNPVELESATTHSIKTSPTSSRFVSVMPPVPGIGHRGTAEI